MTDTDDLLTLAGRFAAAHRVEGSSETADLIDDLVAEVKRLTPREITTVEELEDLPVGSVVRSDEGAVYERHSPNWLEAGFAWHPSSDNIALPARVLHIPEATR
ncbi:hypothetical protein [Gordonia otitidis]|uniref:hypothetical protein n=1 Tax=Gordonia otitidis TaxID=249058 RepID=UPI0002E9FB8C|nr:hypothetical protein [Gordonia otitidis]